MIQPIGAMTRVGTGTQPAMVAQRLPVPMMPFAPDRFAPNRVLSGPMAAAPDFDPGLLVGVAAWTGGGALAGGVVGAGIAAIAGGALGAGALIGLGAGAVLGGAWFALLKFVLLKP